MTLSAEQRKELEQRLAAYRAKMREAEALQNTLYGAVQAIEQLLEPEPAKTDGPS